MVLLNADDNKLWLYSKFSPVGEKYVLKRFTADWDPTSQVEPLTPSSSAAKQRLMAQTRQLEEIKNAANGDKEFDIFYSGCSNSGTKGY